MTSSAPALVSGALLVLVWTLMSPAGAQYDLQQLATVEYSQPRLNTSYRASAEHDARGMEHLYNATDLFLDLIQPDGSAALDGRQIAAARRAGNLTETLIQLGRNWPELVRHHPGFAALAAAGVIIALLIPLIGLVVCCSRCAGSCGGTVDPYEEKFDKCRRICYGIILSLLVLLVLFGLVASFVVNEHAERGIRETPGKLHTAVSDAQLYLNNSRTEVRHLLVNNYRELRVALEEALDRCGDLVRDRLVNISRAVAVDDLTDIADRLTDIRRDLNAVASGTRQVRADADQLSEGLRSVRSELEQLVNSCGSATCRQQLQQRLNLSRLSVRAEFRQLPDVSRTASEIAALIEGGIEREVRAGRRRLDQLSERVQQAVSELLPDVRRQLTAAGDRLESLSTDLTSKLDGAKFQLQGFHDGIDTADHYIDEYGYLRYYLFLLISCLTLVITLCLVLGLFCGCCGRRPDSGYGDDTCNKGSGANFLLSAAGFFCMYGWLLLLLISGMFLLGGLSQYYVCGGLEDPDSPAGGLLQALLPRRGELEQLPPDVDLTVAISRCHGNQSLYSTLQLQNVYNTSELSRYTEDLDMEKQLADLRNRIQVNTAVEILTPLGKRQLYQLADSDVAKINYTVFTKALEAPVSPEHLSSMTDALGRVADQLSGSEPQLAARLQAVREELLQMMLTAQSVADSVSQLKNATLSLQDHVRFNRTSNVTEAVRQLVAQAEQAQLYLSSRGRAELSQLAEQYAAGFRSLLEGYTSRVQSSLKDSLARCGPLSNAYNSTTSTICQTCLHPLNGFWASVGWCLVLFLPCMLLALRLVSLYRKTESYRPGLNSGVDVRVGGKRTSTSTSLGYDNSGRYHSAASRGYAPTGQSDPGYNPDSPPYNSVPPRNRRFRPAAAEAAGADADTAPKAPPLWELAGPPGYSDNPGAVSYERPPPYFYPGPGPERT